MGLRGGPQRHLDRTSVEGSVEIVTRPRILPGINRTARTIEPVEPVPHFRLPLIVIRKEGRAFRWRGRQDTAISLSSPYPGQSREREMVNTGGSIWRHGKKASKTSRTRPRGPLMPLLPSFSRLRVSSLLSFLRLEWLLLALQRRPVRPSLP